MYIKSFLCISPSSSSVIFSKIHKPVVKVVECKQSKVLIKSAIIAF